MELRVLFFSFGYVEYVFKFCLILECYSKLNYIFKFVNIFLKILMFLEIFKWGINILKRLIIFKDVSLGGKEYFCIMMVMCGY